jgi:hypothetical protein
MPLVAIPPAVAPWPTFQEGVIDYFKGVGGPPDIIARHDLRRVTPKMRGKVVSALRALKLIDLAGRTQPLFRTLVEARGTGQWPVQLRVLINNAYPYLSAVDLLKTDSAQLHAAFVAHFKRDAKSFAKAEVFFLNLAVAASLKLSEPLRKRVIASEAMATFKANKKSAAAQPSKPTSASKKDPAVKHENPQSKMTPAERVDRTLELLKMFQGEGMNAEELGAVMTLLKSAQRRAAEGK